MRGVASAHLSTGISDMAPDFDLPVLIGGVKKRFHLREELKQRNVVLAFYPCNWQESSARQLSEYQAQREQFNARRSAIIGVSVDSIMREIDDSEHETYERKNRVVGSGKQLTHTKLLLQDEFFRILN